MELNITEEIDCDNLFDQVDGFMDYPVDDNESGGGGGDGDGKLVQSIEGQEFLTLNDASTNYDPFLSSVHFNSASSLSDELSVPYEDILQLEWLSTFVEDSFSSIGLTLGKDTKKDQFQTSSPLSVLESSTTSSSSSRKAMPSLGPQRARTKRPRPAAFNPFRVFPSEPNSITESPPIKKKIKKKRMGDEYKKKKIEMTFAPFNGSLVQKCLHCGITKTPQWRGGPLGPKTLCNACGVRYKSGRLFPEYRPAASPSFVPSLHSNSHKKVVEIRSKVGHGDAGGAR